MTSDGRSLRGDATRVLVLDTALEMFAEHGYRATSVRDIAARCGMTHPGLLYHFPSKAALLMAALQRRDDVDCVDGEVRELGFNRLDARAVLRHLITSAKNNAGKRGLVELFANLSVEATAPDHPAHDYFVERYATLRATVTRSLTDLGREGALRPGVVPGIAAAQVIAVMDGLQVQWLLDPQGIDMAAALEGLVNGMLIEPL
ncbi:TetR/AcrR family transcriptional regulator [Demequina lutea]|uniref:AcrR family transcriptional regulator n=1 Tax=Demequina lutea TaxID=431489 RepID=A0A7Y9Z8Z0_9MICO|nr:TetR/AcrR family transcriptional regulator [Demequina lutea]NYI41017.1 AcrR family transcriptional regulator [Demequina lutea]